DIMHKEVNHSDEGGEHERLLPISLNLFQNLYQPRVLRAEYGWIAAQAFQEKRMDAELSQSHQAGKAGIAPIFGRYLLPDLFVLLREPWWKFERLWDINSLRQIPGDLVHASPQDEWPH